MFSGNRFLPVRLILFAAVLVVAQASVLAAQQQDQQSQGGGAAAAPGSAKRTAPSKSWSVRVHKTNPATITLQAKNAPLRDIAADIARQLGVPLMLSPLMQQQKVTLEFSRNPVETAMRLLAPQVYADYEVSGDASVTPKPLAYYLQGFNEPPPPLTTVVKGSSEAFIIEGNTEDGTDNPAAGSSGTAQKTEAAQNEPLTVTYEKGQLSVKSVKQPLNIVLFEIANKIGIPFEMQGDTKDIVDVSFSNYTLEQAVHSLASPAIRLYIRTDLLSYETKPLRLVLKAQARS
jgi:type II secretory pathway component GspD/PulD (secretin)